MMLPMVAALAAVTDHRAFSRVGEEIELVGRGQAWDEFGDDYDYAKAFYDVLLPSGEVVPHCWPNAGRMNAVHGDGRSWARTDGIKVRLSATHPMDDDGGYRFDAEQIAKRREPTAADLERLEKARLKRERKANQRAHLQNNP